ncbi:peptidase [Noumeavirus]|uniref:peptidase n=1 Tax=Noumeavirus TaxID=1955558 RepID=UPI000982F7E5|nr:peptidase [Noumeavirus]AQM72987.1 peptidase [Noumeavirus]
MTTNFETRRELTVSNKFIVPVVPNLASATLATPGAVVFDKSTGNLNVATGTSWSNGLSPAATPTTRGTVFGNTGTGVSSATSLGYLTNAGTTTGTYVGYGAAETLGSGSGDCTAVGYRAMDVPSTIFSCTAVGSNSGKAVGDQNISIGVSTGDGATGSDNVMIGNDTGTGMVGSRNILVGTQVADGAITGPFNDNVVIGYQAGRNGTIATGNIVLGSGASPDLGACQDCVVLGRGSTAGTSGSNRIILGASTTGTTNNELTIAPTITRWRSLGLASAAAANILQIDPATGIITQVASSKRFKENIRELEVDTEKLHNLSLKTYNYKEDKREDYGLIAEEAYEILPEIVTLDAEGKPHGIRHTTLAMLLLAEVQSLRKELRQLP